ncbi:MAG: DUF4397 domain-containing protein [Polyangiales bacterium]
MNSKSLFISLVAALSLGLVGCGDDGNNSGGSGGTAGAGGSGGMNTDTAMIRVAHLAPEIPSAENTGVDILVNGEPSGIEDLQFGNSTAYVELPAGDYTFGIAATGSTDSVLDVPATLPAGGIFTVVAYRDASADVPVNVLLFDESADGLMSGSGRVLVGHGADDSLLDPVTVVAADTDTPIVPDFAFGTTAGPLDLEAGAVNIGFDITGDNVSDTPPLEAPITADVVTTLIAVDTDTEDESLAPAVYALLPDSSGPIATLGAPPAAARVRVAHLAPEVPSAGSTAVAILVNGAASGIDGLEFGNVTDYVELPAGEYDFGIAAGGTTESVFDVEDVTLAAGGTYTVVAYRDGAETVPVGVLLFDESAEGLASGEGRVLVGHGADAAAVNPVDIVTDADAVVVDELAFATVAGPLDLAAGNVNIGFDVDTEAAGGGTDANDELDVGPLQAPVTADIVTLLVAVDTDAGAALAPAVYALLPTTSGSIPTLSSP